jgi:hypothetical protein
MLDIVKPNPGGQIDADEIVGRDGLVRQMWGILEGRSIYMNDLRRVGKTQILNRMEALAPESWLVIKRDLGGFHSAAEFAAWTFRDSHDLLGKAQRAFRRMEQLLGALKGTEIAGVLKLGNGAPASWQEVLSRTLSDLQEVLEQSEKRLVFLWDEVPFLLENIAQREGASVAMEVLDLLRSLSQSHSRIRFVLTGSVGLHHVLASLRAEGYVGSPLNHMERIAPGPLSPGDARALASALLSGASVACDDAEACAAAIAEATGNVPFYIHKLIVRLPKDAPVGLAAIDRTVATEIAHPDNDWDFAHYRDRVPIYYGTNAKVVLAILDTIAAANEPLALDDIRRGVSARLPFDDRDQLLELLKLLAQDHYLARDGNGKYAFRFSLIRRWWRFDRSLGAT